MGTVDPTPTLDPRDWAVGRVIAFDWYDGPREGVVRFTHPPLDAVFMLLDERHNPDGVDFRVFRLDTLPAGTVERIQSLLAPLGEPTSAVWVPVWRFESPTEQKGVEEELERLLRQRTASEYVVLAQGMNTLLGVRRVPYEITSADWFSLFQI